MKARIFVKRTFHVAVATMATVGLLAVRVPVVHADLAAPSWWNNTVCDTAHYTGAYSLGGSYNGVKACGPRPIADGGADLTVHFFTGAWGENEWECVELVMRYMYLAYSINPYNAPGGKDVVGNYGGTTLSKVDNDGTALPAPGDILSESATANNAFGHTAVVTAVNVTNGNGSVSTIEQNMSSSGTNSISVVNGVLQDNVTGWLHQPATTPPTYPGRNSDFDIDTKDDIAWHQGTTLYMLKAGSTGFSIAGSSGSIGTADWAGTGINGIDGKSEVYWHQGTTIYVFKWGGTGWSIINSTGGIGTPDAAAVGDFDADGKDDIAWHQGTTLYFLKGNGAGQFSIAGSSGGIGTPDWSDAGSNDGTGKAQVYWHQGTTIYNFKWNTTGWSIVGSTNGIGTPDAAVVGDFDLDTKDDIAWHQGTTLYMLKASGSYTFSIAGSTGGIGTPDWAGAGNNEGTGRSLAYWHTPSVINTFKWTGSAWTATSTTNGIGTPDRAASAGN